MASCKQSNHGGTYRTELPVSATVEGCLLSDVKHEEVQNNSALVEGHSNVEHFANFQEAMLDKTTTYLPYISFSYIYRYIKKV
ncbi:hypothetical protein CDL12_00407 [Handroanthus impetiginosus]|uniref:Uncharacterized protein n=1 Tax=Handroanthus impetiginosus TaxID=429701 RepID=A0A2G9IAY1_9LAMI|nr:hypothetical protein CDL12_00407 [Handroanthus impetiginosus]